MTIRRQWRIGYLIVRELAQKYTRALVGGFVLGLSLTLFITRFYPVIIRFWLQPTERIGIVGEFSPNNLPQSIQNEISFGLTTLDTDGAPIPGLATSWVATDSAKTYTFYLRRDVTWHNRKQVTAHDINYNVKNVTFQTIDDFTIRATLENGYSPFPTVLSKPLFQTGLRGMGVYKVDSIRLDADVVRYLKLVPFAPKDTHKPKEYRFYPTESAAVTGYKLGEIDRVEELTSPYDLHAWGRTSVVPLVKYNHIVSIFFNLTHDVLSEKTVRQALAYAIPKLEGEKAISPLSKNSWGYTDKVKRYETDVAHAKKLLQTAGIASMSATLSLSTFPSFAEEAQIVAESWTNIGIPTEVKIVGSIPSDYQVLMSVQEVPPDPDQYPFWHSTQDATNKTGLANVKIDKLLEDGRLETDTAVRKKIYADFQRYLVEEAPAIFLQYQTVYSIHRL